MAPTKKCKSVNKGFSGVNDSSPVKNEKFKDKKQKLADMLGPQWRKSELHRFYDAYRKYGKDWKKVSVAVRSRSVEMVEALYYMNRAYLSLPDGIASVAGLIAMMTDHYNVMDGSGSEKDTEEAVGMSRKVKRYSKAKGRPDTIRESSFQRHSISSSDRCLSLLKIIDGIQPNIPVRKRTPRIPVSSLDNRPSKKSRASVRDANDEALSSGAMSLTDARQNQNSLHGSQTRYERFDHFKDSIVLVSDKPSHFSVLKPNRGVTANEESADGSLASNGARTGKIFNDALDSGFEKEGAKLHKSLSDVQRKRKQKPLLQDEQVACDALNTLAELSLMMPDLATEPAEDTGESTAGRDSLVDTGAEIDIALKEEGFIVKRKRKSKSFADEDVTSGDSAAQISVISKQCKPSAKSPGVSTNNDRELAVSSAPAEAVSHVTIPLGRKSRYKRDRMLLQKDRNLFSIELSSNCASLFQDRMQLVKDKVSHALSRPDVRRWCVYEWFYSAIDYPWFEKKEFVEYLNHVGLGHIRRLTRDEWGVIRNSLGKPRRFSDRFVQEERVKLNKYRESVRSRYANLRAGLGEGLPTDLARPLVVGQQVIAIHPKTREVHNGSVLTVDRQSCLVQFECSNLGVELVMDIDCMPLNPVENMPESLRRHKILHDFQYSQLPELSGAYMSNNHKQYMDSHFPLYRSRLFVRSGKVKPASVTAHAEVIGNGRIRTSEAKQAEYPNLSQIHIGKDDMGPGTDFTRGLDVKVNTQHRRSPGSPPCWPLLVTNSTACNGTLQSSNSSMFGWQETPLNVVDIVEGSKEKAHKMVDVAYKAISSMREGEDAYGKIGEALSPTAKAECATNGDMSLMKAYSNHAQRCMASQDLIGSSCGSEPQFWGDAFSAKSAADSAASGLRVPSDLITSCVATLLMIQSCTERQYPPSEVAQILDKAVTGLHPCCSQNLSIYREIEMCMGRIKTQILALVPT